MPLDRLQNPPVIYISPVEWSGLKQRPHVIAEYLNQSASVYFVNPVPLRPFRWSDTGRVIDKALSLLSHASALDSRRGMRVINPFYLPFRGAARINESFLRRVVKRIRKQLETEGPGKPPLLWIGSPSPLAVAVMDRFPQAGTVYDLMDDFASFHEDSTGVRRAEERILERADMVFAVSRTLCGQVQSKARRMALAPNGVDLSVFKYDVKKRPRPGDLPRGDIIIGYHGLIGTWFDAELIAEVARARPNWRIALIGPVQRPNGTPRFPGNVVLLGPRPQMELPSYLAHFDVGLIPFTESRVSFHSHPLKVYEYLAMGLPVVSTRIPALEALAPHVRLTSGPEQFIDGIEKALGEPVSNDTIDERLALARANSWQGVFERIAVGLKDIGVDLKSV